MKKRLLFGILIISTLIFGEGNIDKNNEKGIDVEAEVVVPLTINVENYVDFGVIARGQTDRITYPKQFGFIKVTGEAGRNIGIYVRDDKGNYEKVLDYQEVKYKVDLLKINGNGTDREKITAMMNVMTLGDQSNTGEITLIKREEDGLGEMNFNIGGRVDSVREDQAIGEYKGYLHVKVQYE